MASYAVKRGQMVKRSITIGMITGLKGVRLLSIGVSYWYILMAKKDVDVREEYMLEI